MEYNFHHIHLFVQQEKNSISTEKNTISTEKNAFFTEKHTIFTKKNVNIFLVGAFLSLLVTTIYNLRPNQRK